jgi:hypothetical protein
VWQAANNNPLALLDVARGCLSTYHVLQLPDKGKLVIKFKATQPVVYQDDALTDVEFKTM